MVYSVSHKKSNILIAERGEGWPLMTAVAMAEKYYNQQQQQQQHAPSLCVSGK
jgi:hypothetical protein